MQVSHSTSAVNLTARFLAEAPPVLSLPCSLRLSLFLCLSLFTLNPFFLSQQCILSVDLRKPHSVLKLLKSMEERL